MTTAQHTAEDLRHLAEQTGRELEDASALDILRWAVDTFGPQLMYVKAPTKEQGQNLSPALGLQFFGHVAIDGATEVMTVTLKDTDDRALWSTKLEPKLG